MKNKLNRRIEEMKENIEFLEERLFELSQMVFILMKGHETERKHKNIFIRMLNKIKMFKKQELKQKLKEK